MGQPLAKLGAAVNRFGEILHWFDSSHESFLSEWNKMDFVWSDKFECYRSLKKMKVKLLKAAWDNPKKGIYGPQPGIVGISYEQRKIDGELYHHVIFWPENPEWPNVWITPDSDLKVI